MDLNLPKIVQLAELGRFAETIKLTESIKEGATSHELLKLRRLISRNSRTNTAAATPVTLVWQYDAFEMWEGSYIRELVGAAATVEHVDRRDYSYSTNRMIVVDNQIGTQLYDYVRRSVASGCQVVLIHLGDENYVDDCHVYDLCDMVFRNYWSLTQSMRKNVVHLPLGYKSGFARKQQVRRVAERGLLWSFCGDPNKSTRHQMLDALSTLGPKHVHLTSGWDAKDALSVNDYRSIMDDTIFAPCPFGFCTPDSFRIYEALEAGCIPIVERTAEFDYFERAFGVHPMIVVEQWGEASVMIESLINGHGVQEAAHSCHAWWSKLKLQLSEHFVAAFKR